MRWMLLALVVVGGCATTQQPPRTPAEEARAKWVQQRLEWEAHQNAKTPEGQERERQRRAEMNAQESWRQRQEADNRARVGAAVDSRQPVVIPVTAQRPASYSCVDVGSGMVRCVPY